MYYFHLIVIFTLLTCNVYQVTSVDKETTRLKSKEMFLHAYSSYMKYAYPADELMPLSCKGRYRGLDPSRGDIDDILGNFSLTLIDSLDTLFIMSEFDEFERAVKLVIENVNFRGNFTVSVFEVNIRIIGGLLGAHIGALELKKLSAHGSNNFSQNLSYMSWYKDELLWMADEVGKRLLPAFNTHTGIPHPRINLRYGTTSGDNLSDVSTCTACAGTMILEFAALSRLTGNPIFEEKASRAMTYLWEQRNRFSNLMGTIINIHDGNWMRKESGVGAGIDSYYEYLLKAYVLLGDDTYLHRFTTHYDAIKRYISTSELSSLPLFLDVKMHQPLQRTKNFMDSLLAFWPGLQVLFGDIKNAIAFHEILSQVMKRHSFLPEAFTTDFHVYWGHHLLRPEFIESNYFLYHSTRDPYYLEIGAQVLNNLEKHARVKCGFAAIQDVRIMNHSDQMDSFVLAETFKYLYLLFAEPHHLPINLDKYLFTTEGHILPLNLALVYTNGRSKSVKSHVPKTPVVSQTQPEKKVEPKKSSSELSKLHEMKTCENHMQNADSITIITWVFLNFRNTSKPAYKSPVQHLAALIREPLKDVVVRGGSFQLHSSEGQTKIPLLPKDFLPNNPEHINLLKKMGIQVHQLNDGRLQLFHQPNMSESEIWSSIGETFMIEMMKLTQNSVQNIESRFVSIIFNDNYVTKIIKAAPAQFGKFSSSKEHGFGHLSKIAISDPLNACSALVNIGEVANKIVIAKRGDCMFIEKARYIQKAGASGTIIIDNVDGSSFDNSALFSMSGDGENNVDIPVVFIFNSEADILFDLIKHHGISNISVLLSQIFPEIDKIQQYLKSLQKKFKSKDRVKLPNKKVENISEKPHARVDMHFTNLKKGTEEPKTIFDLERIALSRINYREFVSLDQFLLRIYPDDSLSLKYDKLDIDPMEFFDAVVDYLYEFTNIDEIEENQMLVNLFRWAIFFDNDKKRINLPMNCHSAIDILSRASSHLISHKFKDRSELALPSVTSHAISFDILIYLPDNCDFDEENPEHSENLNLDSDLNENFKSDL